MCLVKGLATSLAGATTSGSGFRLIVGVPIDELSLTLISTTRDGLIPVLTVCHLGFLLYFTATIYGRLNYAGFHLLIGWLVQINGGASFNTPLIIYYLTR